jgi:hypothetical protein
MRPSHPPRIAAWILNRFSPGRDTDAIAGDLIEQYRQGRSRSWYWREVTVAVVRGTWSEAWQHRLSLVIAVAMAWILSFFWQKGVAPSAYLLIARYLFGHHARPQDIPLVALLIDGPLSVAMGWTTARFARQCRIPAVFALAVTGLLSSAKSVWLNAQIVWPESLAYHFSVWSLWPIPLMTVLILLGGGLLTGRPKRLFPSS